MFSVQDKFRIRIFVETMADYVEYLPTGGRCEPLADLVFFYIGEQLEWDVELAIPAGAIEPVRLSQFGQLGWTSWMAPNWSADRSGLPLATRASIRPKSSSSGGAAAS